MSDKNSTRIMKSSSEGEILDREETQLINETADFTRANSYAEPKLKRTFTLPRNLLSSRMSKRRAKHKEGKDVNASNAQTISEVQNTDAQKSNKKVFRVPSWKKFINKVVHHMSTVGVPNNKYVSVNYKYDRRRRDTVSLSSSDIRVPPTRPAHLANLVNSDKVPGVTGLRNHGNTCFINAVLQCLSHTDILAEYFVLDQYKVDLSRRNKLNSKKYGTKGEVTEQLALLLKAIWSCQYDPEITNQFKIVVDKYGSQYRGNNQHDAQEFLLWLLDKVHEDLNTATKKKYKIIKNSFGRPDEVVAAETLENHIRCNNSFVHAVFQAQFRSSLTCPRCKRQSNTFDPFLCVSVPVPQNQTRPVYVTVLYTSQQPRQVKLGVSLPAHAEVRELRELLASDTCISENHMLLTEIDDFGFHRTFSDTQPVSIIKETDPVYCLELPQLKEATEDSGAYILLCWVNLLVVDDQCARFSSPYTMQVGRETSYKDLQKLILKEMNTILHDDVLVNSQDIPLFRMRIVDGLGGSPTFLDPLLDHPLYMEAVDQALALCEKEAGPPHLKLVLEWDLQAKDSTIADDSDQMEELASVKQLKMSTEQGGTVSLEECFELYTRAEVLSAEDAWHCPYCNRKQEVVKKLGLWSLPDILVIHLKRFRQQSKQRSTTKLTTLVDFPLYGFDMNPHLADRPNGPPPQNLCSPGGGVLGGLGWSPWKRPRRTPNRPDDNVYDLYAVCNHHGQDPQGGHYTAFCRNPYDAQWYCFDDTRVEPVSETSIVTSAAYILFYQRRGLSTGSYSASSAASTSSSGSGLDHWVYRMPAFNHSISRSQEDLSNKESEENAAPNFTRGARNYSTLQPQPTNKRSVATETEAEHYSEEDAPLASPRSDWPKEEQKSAENEVPAEVTQMECAEDQRQDVSCEAGIPPPPPLPSADVQPPTVVTESCV
ncbi:ubiquitin carboxyl-terminal hydrolase 31 isoform X1 [Schistocerca gregaria]|uniref:ubiquitin carboxyl-terminal hydrolase 31 isoform X1 n=1 Tax=Schistocerca gregaria TaxID=7010 RepID=UPI00211DE65F|nr:ubiquitin carboxyl-terminal hydrolase 31 isoform X1 [Schistocerca gregaria]